MIKIYEALRQNTARLVTNYCGVTLALNFENGNIYAGIGALLKTNDKFVQDAIEHDSRFGVTIRLKQQFKEESDEVEEEAVEETVPAKKRTVKKAVEVADETAEVVKSVKTINDAIDYFAEKGELADGAEKIEALCAKYNVSFPNLKV